MRELNFCNILALQNTSALDHCIVSSPLSLHDHVGKRERFCSGTVTFYCDFSRQSKVDWLIDWLIDWLCGWKKIWFSQWFFSAVKGCILLSNLTSKCAQSNRKSPHLFPSASWLSFHRRRPGFTTYGVNVKTPSRSSCNKISWSAWKRKRQNDLLQMNWNVNRQRTTFSLYYFYRCMYVCMWSSPPPRGRPSSNYTMTMMLESRTHTDLSFTLNRPRDLYEFCVSPLIGASGFEVSLRHCGTNTVISPWFRARK